MKILWNYNILGIRKTVDTNWILCTLNKKSNQKNWGPAFVHISFIFIAIKFISDFALQYMYRFIIILSLFTASFSSSCINSAQPPLPMKPEPEESGYWAIITMDWYEQVYKEKRPEIAL